MPTERNKKKTQEHQPTTNKKLTERMFKIRIATSCFPSPHPRTLLTQTSIKFKIHSRFASSSVPKPSKTSVGTEAPKPFYVSTPIFYVNSVPHIGHLHSMVIADVLGRYNQLKTDTPSFMLTGTDEHGSKVQRAAENNRQSPQELCEAVSDRFRQLARAANVKYDDFIRTTEPRHHRAAQHLWNTLSENGHIYKGKYEGWYSVSDETYYSSTQVEKKLDPVTGLERMTSIETKKPVEWIEEENYMFRLSGFQQALIDWLDNNPNALISSQRSDIMHQLKSHDLADLSISRPTSRLSWGIPVPGDPNQIMYVWLDALSNYLTATGYPWSGKEPAIWPANVHVIGKDIIKFHAIYWPAILMAAGIPLPKHIIAHGHWKIDEEKMSKSIGNVVDPFKAMDEWGVDGVRYYLMRAPGSLWGDSDWAPNRLDEHYRKDLLGQLGNLLARISAPKLWNRLPPGRRSGASILFPPGSKTEIEGADSLQRLLLQLPGELDGHMKSFEIPKALKSIFDVLAGANRLIQDTAPWHESTTPDDAYQAIHLSAEALRISGILLQPFIPAKAAQLLDSLGVAQDGRTWSHLALGLGTGSVVREGGGGLLFPQLRPSK
ncbi:methionyl-tRNA synthetase [Puccinia graminis f. sp. tritici CRL 75-36-700-3]|uniref:Probable methionine--tRNA ligase, mitochondrial n=1 Tax=Puccinia graminis f. sp. tritici (strain CRL 75-36-700-3 / race SCCL) TaxID=418459 RepID=H6QUS3_PUCGT|nr:methionyl-tRNA synthetase [Puccinia graminis f. sp. tritici CRL 75-36-700-3]EHS64831.1 methionyl-tRNA synthetase [Puccinia graminis f. sp. tritici CRL 75-36-700-3]